MADWTLQKIWTVTVKTIDNTEENSKNKCWIETTR